MDAWLTGLGYRSAQPPLRAHPRWLSLIPGDRGTARAVLDALRRLVTAPLVALGAVRRRPAVVMASSPLEAPAVALIKLLLGKRVFVLVDVIGLHSLEIEQTARLSLARAVYRPIWFALERLLFRSADLVVAINDKHADLLAALHGRRDVRIIRDAAEVELTRVTPADRTAVGIPSRATAVCFVGSLVCSRLDRILDAWEELGDMDGEGSRAPLCLVVVGDGPDLRAHRRRAATAGWLGRTVFFLGPQPRDAALAIARACDIAVSDCWPDAGLPFKLYEYMALGMPIAVEGKPQVAELLKDEESALWFRRPGELAGQLRRLAADPTLRSRLGETAREAFLAAHTLDDRQREFRSMLEPVLGLNGGSSR
jgi:glycosyltransferase involved in cell wall biosynthesis